MTPVPRPFARTLADRGGYQPNPVGGTNRSPWGLIRAVVVDEYGQPVFKRALWLVVWGERRGELSLVESWQAYGQRYDLEHYFRFGKQRLLLPPYQTPDTEHEEHWGTLVGLTTMQLWPGRELAGLHLHPWERYLPQRTVGVASPSQVQRDWERIIRLIGPRPNAGVKRRDGPKASPQGNVTASQWSKCRPAAAKLCFNRPKQLVKVQNQSISNQPLLAWS
ncbi:MAG: hypothetical protein HS114_12690 [Anaerolineales bacterium]|nr:hypothetical protein [Anaerolineales bacterium]